MIEDGSELVRTLVAILVLGVALVMFVGFAWLAMLMAFDLQRERQDLATAPPMDDDAYLVSNPRPAWIYYTRARLLVFAGSALVSLMAGAVTTWAMFTIGLVFAGLAASEWWGEQETVTTVEVHSEVITFRRCRGAPVVVPASEVMRLKRPRGDRAGVTPWEIRLRDGRKLSLASYRTHRRELVQALVRGNPTIVVKPSLAAFTDRP